MYSYVYTQEKQKDISTQKFEYIVSQQHYSYNHKVETTQMFIN